MLIIKCLTSICVTFTQQHNCKTSLLPRYWSEFDWYCFASLVRNKWHLVPQTSFVSTKSVNTTIKILVLESHIKWSYSLFSKPKAAKGCSRNRIIIDDPNDPQILTYVKKQITFFRLLSRLNELDLCGHFFDRICV